MGRGWLAFPLLAAVACSPARDYQEAARSLRFRLDRVEPGLRLALPLDLSRMVFKVVLEVANPSRIPFHLVAFAGDLRLESGGTFHPVGHLELARPLELPAEGSAPLEVEVAFAYRDLQEHWPSLQAAARGGSGVWHLEGTLKAVVHGIPVERPVRAERSFGNP